ncbi:MAG: DinB family protein [Acidobacteria bacterium]|nr:DinB family protein [Acidobacteriota bacterium]
MRKSRRLAIKWSLVALLTLGLMNHDGIKPFLFTPSQPESCSINSRFSKRLNDVNSKLVEMAENFPSDRYHFRPSGKTLSFAEQMLHVASHNFTVINAIKGETQVIELAVKEYPTKDKIVKILKESVSEVSRELAHLSERDLNQVEQIWTKSVSHSDEVYGQTIIYYQLNGLIPPSDKAIKEDISKISVGGVSVQACQQLLKKAQYPLSRLSLRRLGSLLQY